MSKTTTPGRSTLAIQSVFCLCLCLCLGLVGCEDTEPDGVEARLVAETGQPPRQAVVMDSVEVLRVLLTRPVTRPDMSGEDRLWEEAFMVRLTMTAPPAMGPAFRIFLNEELVPEYGGWEGGVYFWVYDPNRLDALDGRTISYRFDRGPMVDLGPLTIGDPRTLRRVREDSLVGGP